MRLAVSQVCQNCPERLKVDSDFVALPKDHEADRPSCIHPCGRLLVGLELSLGHVMTPAQLEIAINNPPEGIAKSTLAGEGVEINGYPATFTVLKKDSPLPPGKNEIEFGGTADELMQLITHATINGKTVAKSPNFDKYATDLTKALGALRTAGKHDEYEDLALRALEEFDFTPAEVEMLEQLINLDSILFSETTPIDPFADIGKVTSERTAIWDPELLAACTEDYTYADLRANQPFQEALAELREFGDNKN